MADNHPTVLIIEDEAQIRRFLRATLTANGYQLIEATTARPRGNASTARVDDHTNYCAVSPRSGVRQGVGP